jgi:hypothetical protein
MLSLENVHPDGQISESVGSMKDAVLFADQSIVRAIHFMNQWPKDEVISLEEKEKNLIALTKVKNFALNLLQVLTFAQDAIWKTSKTCDSLSILSNLAREVRVVYEQWRRYVEKVESWVKVVVDSEEKWKSLITVETPTVPATDVSLNSMAETSQTQPPLHFFTKIRAYVKPPVKIHVFTRLYLGKANDLDWNRLKKRYTQQEVESLRAIVGLVNGAGTLLGWNEKAGDPRIPKWLSKFHKSQYWSKYWRQTVYNSYYCCHYFMDEHLVQSLYQWNLMRAALLATEPFQSWDVQVIELTSMSKEEVVNAVKNMVMFADQAIANFIPSVRKNMSSQVGRPWQEKDGCRRMLTEHWLQPFFSTRQAIYETVKGINRLLSKVDTDDERKAWMDIREGIQVVYEDWHRYVEEVDKQVIVVVDSVETKQKYTEKIVKHLVERLMDTVEVFLGWRLVKIKSYTESDCKGGFGDIYYVHRYYINEPLVKSLYKWFQVRAMLLDLETGSI